MPHLAEFGAIEVIGTSGDDAFTSRDLFVIFGREGQDVFTSNPTLSSDQWFFGGSGSDRYVVRPGTSVFVGDGFGSAGDVVRAGGIGFERPYSVFAEVEGRHLLALDFDSFTNVMILDWLSPQRAIERLELADGSRILSAEAIRSLPNYAGNFTLEEIFAGAPPELPDLFRAFVREGFERAQEIETTPQPELVQIIGTEDGDDLVGDARPEIIRGAGGEDQISGNGGADLLDGGPDSDVLRGGSGADELLGGSGADRLSGNAGDDDLGGGAGDDELLGGDQADVLSGNRGNDMLNGGLGDDQLFGDFDADVLLGEAGNDQLSGGTGSDQLSGGDGDDVLSGNRGIDVLHGGPGSDQLFGGFDDDELLGEIGADELFGNRGEDVLSGGAGADQLAGGSADDSLSGGAGGDLLSGNLGDDGLDGRDGDDLLQGNRGSDLLTGGAGSDRFVVGAAEDGIDRISDFAADDVLDLTEVLAGAGLGPTPEGSELDDFLQFSFGGTDTTLAIDRQGVAQFDAADITMIFQEVDLVAGAPDQASVIDGLLASGQLEVV